MTFKSFICSKEWNHSIGCNPIFFKHVSLALLPYCMKLFFASSRYKVTFLFRRMNLQHQQLFKRSSASSSPHHRVVAVESSWWQFGHPSRSFPKFVTRLYHLAVNLSASLSICLCLVRGWHNWQAVFAQRLFAAASAPSSRVYIGYLWVISDRITANGVPRAPASISVTYRQLVSLDGSWT